MKESSSPASVGHDVMPVHSYPARVPPRADGSRLMALSVSSLRLYWKCPERWRRRYLAREREPTSAAMVAGSAAGAAAIAWYAARMRGEALSAADADDLAKAEFAERAARPLVEFGEEAPRALGDQMRKALRPK
jgi:hypothetical protein